MFFSSTRVTLIAPLVRGFIQRGAQLAVDQLARGQGFIEVQLAHQVTQGRHGQLADGHGNIGDFINRTDRIGDLEIDDRINQHGHVVFGDDRLRGEVDDHLAQVDAVHVAPFEADLAHVIQKRHDEMQAARTKPVELAQALDDHRLTLLDDENAFHQHDENEAHHKDQKHFHTVLLKGG